MSCEWGVTMGHDMVASVETRPSRHGKQHQHPRPCPLCIYKHSQVQVHTHTHLEDSEAKARLYAQVFDVDLCCLADVLYMGTNNTISMRIYNQQCNPHLYALCINASEALQRARHVQNLWTTFGHKSLRAHESCRPWLCGCSFKYSNWAVRSSQTAGKLMVYTTMLISA